MIAYPAIAYFISLSYEQKARVDAETRVLAYLHSHNYDISISECADELGIDQEVVSETISRLESEGALRMER